MEGSRKIGTRFPQLSFALLLAACVVCFGHATLSAQEDGESVGGEQFDPASRILTLGEGTDQFYVVRHGERFSIFAVGISAHAIFEAMEPLGGPTYEHATELSRPVTLTMHDVTIEQIVRKMLEGHSFSYRYVGGRLAMVNVLPLNPGRSYKTPPAVESRNRWTEIELDRIAAEYAEDQVAGSAPD